MRGFARTAGRALPVAACFLLPACRLDLSAKNGCATDDDCTEGRVCVERLCTHAPPDSGSVDAGASGGTVTPDGGCDFGHLAPFPSTSVLDTFGSDASLSNWIGSGVGSYFVGDGGLSDPLGDALFWNTALGPDQEAFATIASHDPFVYQMSLLLDAQSMFGDGIYVGYFSTTSDIRVAVREHAETSFVTGGLANLDPGRVELGARVRHGCIEVYVNRQLVGTADATPLGFAAHGGYIGVFSEIQQNPDGGGDPTVWNAFGGGND